MEEGLMFDCINWGNDNCHEEVKKLRLAKKLDEGESIPIWPSGEEKKLDDICKTCEYFESKTK